MKTLIVLLSTLAIAYAGTSKWRDFRVKYSPVNTGVNVNSFFQVEKTLADALNAGWVQVTTFNSLGATTVCRTSRDLRVCPIYDSNGSIAGMQLAVPPSDVEGQGIPYDFERIPVFEKKEINGVLYWTSTYYLVDPETVAAGGRNDATLLGDGLWFKNGTSFTEVPTDEESIRSSTPYTWQNCIPNMGKHYYNNMTPQLSCEDTQPFFLLVQNDDIVGVGWQFFGRTTYVDYNWYDSINSQAVQAVVPLGPTCLSQGADIYGIISIHMYFIDQPWTIPCNQETDSVVPLPIP